jgi:hypothetical protein
VLNVRRIDGGPGWEFETLPFRWEKFDDAP